MFTRIIDAPDYPRGKLRLVKPSLGHAPLSLQWLSDPEVGQYMGADFSDVSLATEEKRIRDILSDRDTIGWMLELNSKIIGAIEINRIKESSQEYNSKSGNFSILIGDKQQWGKRIAPTAMQAVIDWAFTEGEFELLIGKALTSNERSWHNLERLDFEFQGLKPDTLKDQPVEWRVYALAKKRWQSMNPSLSGKIDVPYSNGYYYPPEPRVQVLELIKYKQAGNVLDIGAGFGNNILPLLDHDFRITATETNPDCLPVLNQLAAAHPGKISVKNQPLELLNPGQQFDVIICTMVLHFLAPKDARSAIDHIQTCTQPGGINVVTSYTANNEVEQLQNHGVKFLFETGELKTAYEGWKILSYEEAPGSSKNALSTAFESARLIAQKP